MKILLICGFLGAGKTTFIKTMAKATEREFVIVENEFAEEGIDAQTLRRDETTSKMDIWEIDEGCICCSLNLDFTLSILTIANTLNPDYLLVEPSGVAQPSNIINKIQKIQYDRISLLAPITIIDAQNFSMHRREFRDYFEDQLISAGTLVLSKSEHLKSEDFMRIATDLHIPEDVTFPKKHYSRWKKKEWMELLEREFTGENIQRVGERFTSRAIKREADKELESISLDKPCFQNPDQLVAFMESILHGRYGQVIRAKGSVLVNGESIHTELVAGKFSLIGLGDVQSQDKLRKTAPETNAPHRDKLIIIGKYLQKSELLKAVEC